MGKKMTIEITAPDSPMDMLKDAVLFTGDFKWMFYLCLAGFCAGNARAILTANKKINYFHGCVLMVLVSYGGSTMAAIMCGKPVVFAVNEALVSVCIGVWTAMYFLGNPDAQGLISLLKNNSIGMLFSSLTYEIMRCHVAINCSLMAQAALSSSMGRVAIIGPLIAGTLGGCGGGFMPLNKGLDPLSTGLNWRTGSSAINSVWLFLSLQSPSYKDAIGLSAEWAKVCSIAFFALGPFVDYVLQAQFSIALFGANSNPLMPPVKRKKA